MESTHIDTFADAVLHELRTPLSVVVGEVDLALARERSAAAYRETLVRIAESVAELVDLTADLSSIVASTDRSCAPRETARLGAVLGVLADRYGSRRGVPVTLAADSGADAVTGAADVLAGALSLVVEHALKHRPRGSSIRIERRDGADGVDLVIAATPTALPADAWQSIDVADDRAPLRRMRLHAATTLVRRCGGSLAAMSGADAGSLLVRLCRAEAAAGER